jgi:D-serine deaminase-like pyridoxal phosphate-dependent protein
MAGRNAPMSTESLETEIAREFGTPAVVIDLDRVEANIARVQKLCEAAGVANRPHIKTHKSPVLAKMQVAAGAKGITCQKLGEAEVMVAGGIDDILISYNLLGEEKVGRLGRLLQRAQIVVAADNPTTIAGLPQAAEIAGRPLGVVIECDTGRKRAGVETAKEAVELAGLIKEQPGLRFDGFLFIRRRRRGRRRSASSTRPRKASARSGSKRASSRPAARPTSPTWGSSRAPPSIAPAPTSSTTA